MPITPKFNIEIYTDPDYISILSEEIAYQMMKVTVMGAYPTITPSSLGVKISMEDLEEFKNSEISRSLLLARYERLATGKVEEYGRMKAMADYVLFDYNRYQDLLKLFDTVTYCFATNELREMLSRQCSGRSVSKAKYRSRRAMFHQTQCV